MGQSQGDIRHLSGTGSAPQTSAASDESLLHGQPCWIVPAAGPWGPACRQASASLQLPNLQALWSLLQAGAGPEAKASDAPGTGSGTTLTLPHERALLEALGLPQAQGHTPWAAWALQGLLPEALTPPALRLREPGPNAWAWFQPCHWSAGSHDIRMDPPQLLSLSDEESQALLAAVARYAAQDGISLEWVDAGHWLAQGEALAGVASASADRILGESLQTWLPLACPSGLLRRLQNEMQMLLYTHPINEARGARGLPTVNAFWPWGLGASTAVQPARRPSVHWVDALCAAARADDAPAWVQAWHTLDANEMAHALTQVRAGKPLRLVLCGAQASLCATISGAVLAQRARKRSVGQRLAGLFSRRAPVTPVAQLLERL